MHGIALITGASRGIGAAIARQAARAGYDLALNYARDTAAAENLAEELRASGRRVISMQADIADEGQVLRMFERIDAELGPLTALVNNAGIVVPGSRLLDMDPKRWQRLFEVNVFGALLCSREAAKRMSTARGGRGGAIVNISSRAAQLGSPGFYVDYAASKGALDTLTTGLGRELIEEGIRVNGVRSGIIETEIHQGSGLDEAQLLAAAAQIPIRRLGRAEEVAEAVLWLLSDAASYTVGATLDVAGGR